MLWCLGFVVLVLETRRGCGKGERGLRNKEGVVYRLRVRWGEGGYQVREAVVVMQIWGVGDGGGRCCSD